MIIKKLTISLLCKDWNLKQTQLTYSFIEITLITLKTCNSSETFINLVNTKQKILNVLKGILFHGNYVSIMVPVEKRPKKIGVDFPDISSKVSEILGSWENIKGAENTNKENIM